MKLIDSLKEKLHKGIVSFTYLKKDGETRHARGTLLGVGHTIKGTSKRIPCSLTLQYYDLDCHGWRSFRIENLVEVGDITPTTIEEHHNICLALVVKLKKAMAETSISNPVAFAFRKANGEIRYAHGIILPSTTQDTTGKYVVYYDTDKMEERKFRIDSFLGFGEMDEVDVEQLMFSPNTISHSSSLPSSETSISSSSLSSINISSILESKGIKVETTEDLMIIDLLPYLNKEQLKELIINATTRLAEL